MNLVQLSERANRSPLGRWLLNQVLWKTVPFNRPHRLWVEKCEPEQVNVRIPFKRSNRNHIKGLHACVMLTAAEYASGLLLLLNLNPKEYRIIMKRIEGEYSFQGKMQATASYSLSQADLESQVKKPLETTEKTELVCMVPVHDSDQNLLCTVKVVWQIKSWKHVKTKNT